MVEGAYLMKLRPYQSDAVQAAIDELRDNFSTLMVLPTGAGKTICFVEVVKRFVERTGKRALILAHREELVNQAADKVASVLGEKPAIEMADQTSGYTGSSHLFAQSAVVVGSVQSVCRPNRLARLDPNEFGLIVVDEAHHCTPQNRSYHQIVSHFRGNDGCKLLGVTATPDRSDRLALGQVFETVAYEMTILDAIDGGWLVPIEQQYVTVQGLDFSKVRTTAGDLNDGDLDALMNQDGGRLLHEIASATVQAANDEPTLVFCNSVNSADAIAKIINRYPNKQAVCLHGGTPKEERRYWLAEYAKGTFQFLVGCDLFLEGFDAPRISIVSNAKPTKSRSRYTQCVGRGTRTLPGTIRDDSTAIERKFDIASSVKSRLLVLDFVGNAAQHKLISTADILGGRYAPAAILEAVEAAKDSGEPVDMRQAMQAAKDRLAEEEERKRQMEEKRAREEAERKEREWLRAQAQFETREIDPFGVAVVGGVQFSNGRLKKPTPSMVNLLNGNGIDASSMTYGEAAAAIGDLQQYWSGQLCSPKQSAKLSQYGENPRSTRDQAKALLDVISARGWSKRDYKLTRDKWRVVKNKSGDYQPAVQDPAVGRVVISAKFKSETACRDFISKCIEKE